MEGEFINLLANTPTGLFTAHQYEENWAIAHRILTPCFGPLTIRAMLPGMIDIASQLMLKVIWGFLGGHVGCIHLD